MPLTAVAVSVVFIVRIVLPDFDNRAQNVELLLEQLQPEEIQAVADVHEASSILESPLSEVHSSSADDDSSVVYQILEDDGQSLAHIGVDPESSIPEWSDQDIVELVSILAQQYSLQ